MIPALCDYVIFSENGEKIGGLYEFKAIIVLNIQVNAGGVVNVVEQGLYALAEDLEELREEVGDKVDKEEVNFYQTTHR